MNHSLDPSQGGAPRLHRPPGERQGPGREPRPPHPPPRPRGSDSRHPAGERPGGEGLSPPSSRRPRAAAAAARGPGRGARGWRAGDRMRMPGGLPVPAPPPPPPARPAARCPLPAAGRTHARAGGRANGTPARAAPRPPAPGTCGRRRTPAGPGLHPPPPPGPRTGPPPPPPTSGPRAGPPPRPAPSPLPGPPTPTSARELPSAPFLAQGNLDSPDSDRPAAVPRKAPGGPAPPRLFLDGGASGRSQRPALSRRC
uniref:Basic proline-rich protein-like n=1 Tax=Callorhinus ursinus TaxID=34884 RepID=A0A3Q7NF51_CALUR|nr:basic proline-rich protein-like [Callorhinus ursinus]